MKKRYILVLLLLLTFVAIGGVWYAHYHNRTPNTEATVAETIVAETPVQSDPVTVPDAENSEETTPDVSGTADETAQESTDDAEPAEEIAAREEDTSHESVVSLVTNDADDSAAEAIVMAILDEDDAADDAMAEALVKAVLEEDDTIDATDEAHARIFLDEDDETLYETDLIVDVTPTEAPVTDEADILTAPRGDVDGLLLTSEEAHEIYADAIPMRSVAVWRVMTWGLCRGFVNLPTAPGELARGFSYEFTARPWYAAMGTSWLSGFGGTLGRVAAGMADVMTLGYYGDTVLSEGFPDYVWQGMWRYPREPDPQEALIAPEYVEAYEEETTLYTEDVHIASPDETEDDTPTAPREPRAEMQFFEE